MRLGCVVNQVWLARSNINTSSGSFNHLYFSTFFPHLVLACVHVLVLRSWFPLSSQTLRKTLDTDGFSNVKIVAADSSFAGISKDILNDKELSDAVSVIG